MTVTIERPTGHVDQMRDVHTWDLPKLPDARTAEASGSKTEVSA